MNMGGHSIALGPSLSRALKAESTLECVARGCACEAHGSLRFKIQYRATTVVLHDVGYRFLWHCH